MSTWFRSAEMSYVSLIVSSDSAHSILSSLGHLSALSFTDLNPDLTPFQRQFVSYVKRCDELERKLRYFGGECDKFGLEVKSERTTVADFLASSNTSASASSDSPPQTGSALLTSLETELESYEDQLKELNNYSEKLTTEYNEKVELQEVLLKSRDFFDQDVQRLQSSTSGGFDHGSDAEVGTDEMGSPPSGGGKGLSMSSTGRGTESLLASEMGASALRSIAAGGEKSVVDPDRMKFSSITGVIASEEKSRFERMIFRATRGNCYVRFAPIEKPIIDPETSTPIHKQVFIIFYKSASIETKLKKICDAFSAHRYSLPSTDDGSEIERMLNDNSQELNDSHVVLSKNSDTRYRLCQMLATHVERWTWTVLKEKGVYHSLNMFKSDVSGMLRAEGWLVTSSLDDARQAISKAQGNHDSMPCILEVCAKPWPSPPTYFKTNEFTSAYQDFVDTYGVPRYQEANPALFTAATFPFLFGVMYGDIGHGSCLLMGGLYLVYTNKPGVSQGEMLDGLYGGRYMITMMGAFAVYAGLIYNDFFSLGLNIFSSRWNFEGQDDLEVASGTIATQTADYASDASVYSFGLDPAWHVSSNELLFFNSFKMKLSVILGIIQMFMGTCLKGSNAIFFGEKLDFFFEFLPMVVFAASLFIYMIFLIVYKWCTNWQNRMLSATCINVNGGTWGQDANPLYTGDWVECDSGYCTPWGFDCEGGDELTGANMCDPQYGGCQPPNLITTLINIALQPGTVEEPMYKGQAGMQNFLLICAFISVPTLLFAKPYFVSRGAESKHDAHGSENSDTPLHEGEESGGDHGHGESFGEVLIHQAIETIEFVLGMVSNTASYLRLWALSLAHSKLAGVFWEKAMLSTIEMNFFAAFIGYGVFAAVTCAVLLMMDVLECFLHALRLHWVEFQNKFYKADGVKFAPFSFTAILKNADL